MVRNGNLEFSCDHVMATHSSVLAWRIPGTEEPGGLPSVGSHSRTRLKRLSRSSSMMFECLLIISLYLVPKLHHRGPNTFDHQLRQELCLVECRLEPARASLLRVLFLRYSNRISIGFPDGSDGKRICSQCRRPRLDPWVEKVP